MDKSVTYIPVSDYLNGDSGSVCIVGMPGNVTTNLYSFIDEDVLDTGDYLKKKTAIDTGVLFNWNIDIPTDSSNIWVEVFSFNTTSASETGQTVEYCINDLTHYQGIYISGSVSPYFNKIVWNINPKTSSPWTVNEINNGKFGFFLDSMKVDCYLYKGYVTIHYTIEGESSPPTKKFLFKKR